MVPGALHFEEISLSSSGVHPETKKTISVSDLMTRRKHMFEISHWVALSRTRAQE